jgi:7,8-dihydroneopterin aldolase/epimerase/oxygenase
MDFIFLNEFRAETIIGIYPWEREVPQTIQLDLEIGLPHSRAGISDDVADTIDYGRVVERIREVLAERHFSLVEALAEHIAQLVMREFGSPWLRISVTKLGLIRGVKRLGITIERGTKS